MKKCIILFFTFNAGLVCASPQVFHCVSYSKVCSYSMALNSERSSIRLKVLDPAQDDHCLLSPDQVVTLDPSQDTTAEWLQFDGASKKDKRALQLRVNQSEFHKATFEAKLNISLQYNESSFWSISITCSHGN